MIAIIAILASLLLPMLHRAKGAALAAQCASNLKQFHLAWQLYADDNNGSLVPNFETGNVGSVASVCSTSNSWVVGSAFTSASTDALHQGALWRYTQSEGVYRCPSDKSQWPYGGRPAPRPFNVALSVWMNGGWNGANGHQLGQDSNPPWGPSVAVKSTEIRRPPTLFTFMDEDAETMCSGAFWVNLGPTDSWWHLPGARDRRGGANIGFADGHVEFHLWRFPSRRWLGGWGQSAQNDLDRVDLAWLVSRVP